jgi:Ca-activated chloride channel family protein
MVMPPAPAALEDARPPREVTFVIDTSGSMHGASIEQARSALHLALARPGPADAFNVIQFNHRTHALFPAARAATPEARHLADRYVVGLRAEGGTEMLPALLPALGPGAPSQGARLRQVVFLTDGAVGNEAQLFGAIRERLGDRRLFTIGIGSAGGPSRTSAARPRSRRRWPRSSASSSPRR